MDPTWDSAAKSETEKRREERIDVLSKMMDAMNQARGVRPDNGSPLAGHGISSTDGAEHTASKRRFLRSRSRCPHGLTGHAGRERRERAPRVSMKLIIKQDIRHHRACHWRERERASESAGTEEREIAGQGVNLAAFDHVSLFEDLIRLALLIRRARG